MTVVHKKIDNVPTCFVSYTVEEWDFIETLSEIAQRNIIRGLATPYDYGYKKPQHD